MGQSPMFGPETKTWVVLAMLSGEIVVAGAAGRGKASKQSFGRWKVDFLEAGEAVLTG